MIGCDLVAISRFNRLFANEKFYQKIFSKSELEFIKSIQTLAGFFAAKEAIGKALGCGLGKDCAFKDITLFKDAKGKPCAKLASKVAKMHNCEKISISISHDAGFAMAVAILDLNSQIN